MNRILILTALFFFLPLLSCDSRSQTKGGLSSKQFKAAGSRQANSGNESKPIIAEKKPIIKQYTFEIIRTLPHDPEAFTQGLIYYEGLIFESTGLRGKSTLRKIDPMTGNVLQKKELAPYYFSEGIAISGGRIYMLTYVSQVCLVFGLESLKLETSISYNGEGWGLAYNGDELIMSDGSNFLRFIRPENFEVVRGVGVYGQNGPVSLINEMEYVGGEIYANVWQQDRIVRIDPATGDVCGWIDFTSLRRLLDNPGKAEVFNGIAYNPVANTFYVTGKYWDKMFEIKLIEKK